MTEDAGWTRVAALVDLSDGRPQRVQAGGHYVLLCLAGDRLFAVDDRCSHQGAPLHRGVVKASGSLPSVTCPMHGSMFGLADGRVLRGPAMAPLASYETRVREGMVEIRSGAD